YQCTDPPVLSHASNQSSFQNNPAENWRVYDWIEYATDPGYRFSVLNVTNWIAICQFNSSTTSAHWSEIFPVERVPCNATRSDLLSLPMISVTFTDYPGDRFTDTVSIACANASTQEFVLSPSVTQSWAVCTVDAVWSNQTVWGAGCKEKLCPVPSAPPSWTYQTRFFNESERNFTPLNVSANLATMTPFPTGQVAIFSLLQLSCPVGHKLPAGGPSEMTCQPNKTWSTYQLCERYQCADPPTLSNASIQSSFQNIPAESWRVYDWVEYVTQPGFRFSEHNITTWFAVCEFNSTQASAQWSIIPLIERVPCNATRSDLLSLPMISVTFPNYPGDRFTDTVSIACANTSTQEFVLSPSVTQSWAVCTVDTVWSNQTIWGAGCRAKLCPVLAGVPNQTYQSRVFNLASQKFESVNITTQLAVLTPWPSTQVPVYTRVSVTCPEGHVLPPASPSEVLCQPNKTWSDYRLCERLSCPAPPQLVNASLNGSLINDLANPSVWRVYDAAHYRAGKGMYFVDSLTKDWSLVCRYNSTSNSVYWSDVSSVA
uniref:Sushi domain-containing protein n=1 Tax=Macrostomum lignano TaxID=282301 RepID=A0A1I8JHT3_9PLAT